MNEKRSTLLKCLSESPFKRHLAEELAELERENAELKEHVAYKVTVIENYREIIDDLERENAELRAKLEEVEKQEPVAYLNLATWRRDYSSTFATLERGFDNQDALYARPAPIPEGWQLVPKKGTADMFIELECCDGTWQDCYAAMLAAAPQPKEK